MDSALKEILVEDNDMFTGDTDSHYAVFFTVKCYVQEKIERRNQWSGELESVFKEYSVQRKESKGKRQSVCHKDTIVVWNNGRIIVYLVNLSNSYKGVPIRHQSDAL